jgi:hypothetical protein
MPVPNAPAPALSSADAGDILMAAREADHLAHCTPCRERAAASDAAITENGESMQRRDRVQLGLRNARRAVTA